MEYGGFRKIKNEYEKSQKQVEVNKKEQAQSDKLKALVGAMTLDFRATIVELTRLRQIRPALFFWVSYSHCGDPKYRH